MYDIATPRYYKKFNIRIRVYYNLLLMYKILFLLNQFIMYFNYTYAYQKSTVYGKVTTNSYLRLVRLDSF